MKKPALFAGLVLFLCLGATTVLAAEEPYPWKAGAAEVVITPAEPMVMGGYGSRDEPFETVLHDLWASALVLEDQQGQRLVLVTLDLITITGELRNTIAAEAKKRFGLNPESLWINISHTHTGPEIRSEIARLWGRSESQAAQCERYYKSLPGKVLDVIGQALEGLEPAKLDYSYARAGFAMNRRTPIKRNDRIDFVNRPHPDGPVDHQVPVLRVTDPKGTVRALVFGYACHCTTLSRLDLSGDYAGFAKESLRKVYPKAIPLFVTGCGADQNPYPRHRSTVDAQTHGKTLAYAVQAALSTHQYPVAGPLRVALEPVTLQFATPPTKETLERQAKSSNRFLKSHAKALLDQIKQNGKIADTYDVPIQVVRFGDDLLLIALPGETVVDYSLKFKDQYGEKSPVWVAGYSNDVFGYLPSLRVLEEGGYEGGGAFNYSDRFPGPFEKSVESRVTEKVDELVRKTEK